MGKPKDDKDMRKLALQMGQAAKSGDADKLAELAAQVPKDEDGRYVI